MVNLQVQKTMLSWTIASFHVNYDLTFKFMGITQKQNLPVNIYFLACVKEKPTSQLIVKSSKPGLVVEISTILNLS